MRTTSIFFFTILIIVISISSCSTDVDLIEEGSESAVVTGFIDPTVDTQFVKITKTFVTEGSAVDAALDPTFSEYSNLTAYVIAYDGNDSVDSYLLQEKTVTNKDSGAFYYPVQTVYYFTEPIDFDYTYGLSFFGSDKQVSAFADVVGAFKNNTNIETPTINLVSFFNVNGSTYQSKNLVFIASKNVRRYEFTLRYYYTEQYTDGTSQEKFMDFTDPAWITGSLSGTEEVQFNIVGEEFYQAVAGRIQAQNNEANVDKRIIGRLTYTFEYTGDDFNTFIELSEPSTSINVEQNPFTNIENGIGLWSSRGSSFFDDKELSFSSIQEMAIGQFTTDFKFCSDDPGHNGTSWGCN